MTSKYTLGDALFYYSCMIMTLWYASSGRFGPKVYGAIQSTIDKYKRSIMVSILFPSSIFRALVHKP